MSPGLWFNHVPRAVISPRRVLRDLVNATVASHNFLRQTLRLSVSLAIVWIVACGPHATSIVSVAAPWVRFMDNGRIAVALDTATIVRDTSESYVDLRIDYARPQPVPSQHAGRTYVRTDVSEFVRCASRRVRDIRLAIFDSAGKEVGFRNILARGSQWQTFDEHPMTAYIFDQLCKQLALIKPKGR